MGNDRGQWRGVGGVPGWQQAIKGANPSLTAPQTVQSDDNGGFIVPKNGLPVALPPNTYISLTGQTLVIDLALNVAAGATVTAFTFTVPTQYNGWILDFDAYSEQNDIQGVVRETYLTPLLNNQRIWPFVGDPNNQFKFYPAFLNLTTPLQIQDGNVLSVQVTNGFGIPDYIEMTISGWIDQAYVPNPGANRVG